MKRRNNQQGFTIIELVVVILLLGILTATALPRFMDVTDEAHAAVVDGVQSGLQTGVALFRAQWVGTGQPTSAITEFGGLMANASGYPVDLAANTIVDADSCVDIYENLMQAGGLPTIAGIAYAATPEATVEGAAANVDFVAMVGDDNPTNPTVCTYYYVGQYKSGDATTARNIPNFTYDSADGVITRNTDAVFNTN